MKKVENCLKKGCQGCHISKSCPGNFDLHTSNSSIYHPCSWGNVKIHWNESDPRNEQCAANRVRRAPFIWGPPSVRLAPDLVDHNGGDGARWWQTDTDDASKVKLLLRRQCRTACAMQYVPPLLVKITRLCSRHAGPIHPGRGASWRNERYTVLRFMSRRPPPLPFRLDHLRLFF